MHSLGISLWVTWFCPFPAHRPSPCQVFNTSIIFLMIFIPCFNIATIFAGFLPGLLDSLASVCFRLLFSYYAILYDFVSYPFLYSLKLCLWPLSSPSKCLNQNLLGLMWFAFPANHKLCLNWKFFIAFAISLSALKHNRVSICIIFLTASCQFKVFYKMEKDEGMPE